jgi:parallel beta-helix repeat protein
MVLDNARKQGPGPSAPAKPTPARKQRGYFIAFCAAVVVIFTFISPAAAQTCGGAVACTCGYTITASRTFSSADFAGVKTCPADALIIGANGITVDVNGKTIRGSKGAGTVGLRIEGHTGVTVTDGRFEAFETGVRIANGSTDVTIDGIEAYRNAGNGILIESDGNEVIASPGRHNGINGMRITGNNNTVRLSNNEYNGNHGFLVEGIGNQLISNWASENNDHGIVVAATGDGTLVQTNRITKLNRHGIFVDGASNVRLEGNFATKQRNFGINIVNGIDAVLINNKVTESSGISVTGSGDANDSQNNVSNRGVCIIYGVSDVPGICDIK